MTEEENEEKWHPSIVVALIKQGGKTLRWAVAGAGVFIFTELYLPGCDCEVAQDVQTALKYVSVFCMLVLVVGVSGVLYGRSQRALRLRKTKQLQARITDLETMIDPNRSSSGLQKTGETHPEDKLS